MNNPSTAISGAKHGNKYPVWEVEVKNRLQVLVFCCNDIVKYENVLMTDIIRMNLYDPT